MRGRGCEAVLPAYRSDAPTVAGAAQNAAAGAARAPGLAHFRGAAHSQGPARYRCGLPARFSASRRPGRFRRFVRASSPWFARG